jgi:hypothetical protein
MMRGEPIAPTLRRRIDRFAYHQEHGFYQASRSLSFVSEVAKHDQASKMATESYARSVHWNWWN